MISRPFKATPALLPAVLLRLLAAVLSASTAGHASAQTDPAAEQSEWLLNSLKQAFVVESGATVSFRHLRGDVRVGATDTDRLQVTAMAQYHSGDPRLPEMRLESKPAGEQAGSASYRLHLDFADLEVEEREAWAKRRIDVGLLVPRGVAVEIETTDGLIEAKDLASHAQLSSQGGDISYRGTGSVTAHSERGKITASLRQTTDEQAIALSTLTGDIRCIFLEGANAQIELQTQGAVTTDFTVEIDRAPGSLLKKGRAQLGQGGAKVSLESHGGGLRLQGLLVAEPDFPEP